MVSERTRRAVLGAALGGGLAATAVPTVRRYLRQFAPLSGGVWDAASRDVGGEVESPYGDATVRRDEWGVPHVDAESEPACSYAIGYVHGVERLFQMDLSRRQMRGQLSELAGEATVDSDEFHVKMDFARAAEANLEPIAGTETEAVLEAYVDGVNAAREREPLPLEFRLLEYEPDPWTLADGMLVEKQIGWVLTGNFAPLRRGVVANELGADAVDRLYPATLDHDAPILRERELDAGTRTLPDASDGPTPESTAAPPAPEKRGTGGHRVGPDLAGWASQFESPRGVGSNSWAIGGEHTESGAPILANDPHLSLIAPPVWYEQHLECPAFSVRGAAFPGAPFVVIGENHAGAWGVTNSGVDVCDHYTYETDGDRYRYGDEWREFETEERVIGVSGADDRTVEVRTTVHGPVIEREGSEVAVSWVGLAATETVRAVRQLAHSDGLTDAVAASRTFDLPHQNLLYVDRDGNVFYWVTGRIPVRRTDGDPVPADRVFDGSAREGEWEGFEPYGVPDWSGFVDFEDKPGVVNPDYLATANQRIVDDPDHYLGHGWAPPFRGARAYELLDAAVDGDGPLDPEFAREVQRDVLDRRGRLLVADVLDAVEDPDGPGSELVGDLENWDHETTTDSPGALAFAVVLEAFREVVFEEPFGAAGLDAADVPNDWILLTLPADDPWFDRDDVPDRDAALVEAVERAATRIDEAGHETYADVNRLGIDHPFGVGFLGYDEVVPDGSPGTLRNVRVDSDVGSSWRMVAPMDGDARAVLPGGNSGDYFSAHYADQLQLWVDGGYKSMAREHRGDAFLEFTGGGDS